MVKMWVISSMKISLLWRFGFGILACAFPSSHYNWAQCFTVIDCQFFLQPIKQSLYCIKPLHYFVLMPEIWIFEQLGCLRQSSLGFFPLHIPSVLHHQVPQQMISCKNTVKIGSFLHKASTHRGISDLDRFQGYSHYNESQ